MIHAYQEALQTMIDEFKNISPDISSAAIFSKEGATLAFSETIQGQTKDIDTVLFSVVKHSQIIGGMETLTIQGVDSQLNVTSMNSLYLATVSAQTADPKVVKSLTTVFVPTMVRLVDQIAPDLSAHPLPESPQVKPRKRKVNRAKLHDKEKHDAQPVAESDSALLISEPLLPDPPVNQFMVEKIRGFLAAPDTARIDSEVISKWHDLYGTKQINMVTIQTLEGKTTNCRFKPIKEIRFNSKGIIQLPERILQTLQTSKGKLVVIKPVIQ